MKHYTSIEQGKKLVELGLNPETADMCYLPTHLGEEHHWIASLASPVEVCKCRDIDIMYCIPCWSVGALIKLLPHDIVYQTKLFEPTHCILNLSKTGVGYSSSIDRYTDRSFNQCWMENPNLVDALYNCMVWLLENGYIKKGE